MSPRSASGRRLRPAHAAALAVLPVLLALAGPGEAKELNVRWSEGWGVGPADRLVLVHDDGDVTVTPWKRDSLAVEVVYRARVTRVGIGGDADFRVDAERDGDAIRIETVEIVPGGTAAITVHNVEEYRVVVHAPASLPLELRGDDGDVAISGWRGRVFVHGGDGDVRMSECAVEATIDLDDGDVDVRDCAGAWDVRVHDGDVRLAGLMTDALRVRADDGDLDVELVRTEGIDAELRTEDGDVTLRLPSGHDAAIILDTDDGDLDLDAASLRGTALPADAEHVRLPGGDGEIRIRTEDGDIRLRQR